jgi:hypothetical protein
VPALGPARRRLTSRCDCGERQQHRHGHEAKDTNDLKPPFFYAEHGLPTHRIVLRAEMIGTGVTTRHEMLRAARTKPCAEVGKRSATASAELLPRGVFASRA